MAVLIACANSGFTTATTWALVDPSSYIDSELGTVVIGVANIDSPTFAPGAITVDGVAVKVSSRAAVPGANTFTITLRDSTGGADVDAVTINVSDINNVTPGGWYFVKFGSSHLLVGAGNLYLIRCVASAAAMVTLFRSTTGANNFSKMLRETATQAPVADNQFHVLGEWTAAATVTARTVTMDEVAATSYGPTVSGGPPQGATIGKSGTLDWGTTGGVAYILYLKGILRIYSGGTMNIGTSGTPMPSNSTALFQMTSVANVDSGLVVDGTLNAYGATKAVVATLLTSNLAGGTKILQVVSTSGWASGDQLGIAPTTRTATQFEKGTIDTIDSAVQVTLLANVANAHSGTAPTQAEVINLTRNVVLRGASTTLQGYISVSPTSVVNIEYVEMYQLGSAVAGKRGFELSTTFGSLSMQYSALHDFIVVNSVGINIIDAASNNFTISNNVLYGLNSNGVFFTATTGTTWTISNNIVIGVVVNQAFVLFAPVAGVFTGNTGTGAGSSVGEGLAIDGTGAMTGTIANNTFHSNSRQGVRIANVLGPNAVISNTTVWRNNGTDGGIRISTAVVNLTLDGVTAFGNNTYNISMFSVVVDLMTIKTMVSNGDTTFSTTNGIATVTSCVIGTLRIVDSDFSTVAGIKTAHTNDIAGIAAVRFRILAYNSKFGAATLLLNLGGFPNSPPDQFSGLFSMLHNQAAGDHRRFLTMGNALTNTGTFKTASPSEELIPSSASVKMESGPKQVTVASGATRTFSVWVYKHAAYGGAQPRLILRANLAIGVASDVLLDTMAGGTGAWEELTGVTPAASADGVFEAFVDCDTSGSIYVDDWSVI